MLPITARGSKETRAHAVAPLVDAFCHGALWLEGRYWKAQGIQPVVTPLLVSR
jgi:hypothetical protein